MFSRPRARRTNPLSQAFGEQPFPSVSLSYFGFNKNSFHNYHTVVESVVTGLEVYLPRTPVDTPAPLAISRGCPAGLLRSQCRTAGKKRLRPIQLRNRSELSPEPHLEIWRLRFRRLHRNELGICSSRPSESILGRVMKEGFGAPGRFDGIEGKGFNS